MEILPVDIRYIAYSARTAQKRLSDAYFLSNIRIGTKLAIQHGQEIKHDFQQLYRLRKLSPALHFRIAANAHQDLISKNYPLYQMTNGIVGSSTLYYRVAKDINNKKLNLFWSHTPERLHAEKNEHGVNIFTSKTFRYQLATFEPFEKMSVIRDTIRKHHHDFREFGINKMTVYGGDFTDIHGEVTQLSKRKHKRKVYIFTNDAFAVSVHENSRSNGGGWTLKISKPYEMSTNQKSFVEVDSLDTNKEFIKSIFSNGAPYENYKTKQEALANAHMIINRQTQMVWDARDPSKIKFSAKKVISLITNATTETYNFIFKELKKPENRDEASFDTVRTILTAVATRAVFAVSLPITITAAVFGNFGIRKLTSLWKAAIREISWQRKGAAAFYPLRAPYIKEIRRNMNRIINTIPNIEMDKLLHALTGKEIDLTYDPQRQRSPIQKRPELMELCAHEGKGVARKVAQIDKYTSTEISFNGLARLVRKDPKNGKFITYVKYISVFNVNDKISLSPKARELLKDGKIIKLTQTKGKVAIEEKTVSVKTMEREISKKLFCDDDNVPAPVSNAAKKHINWLFNNGAYCKETTPKPDDDMSYNGDEISSQSVSLKDKLKALQIIHGKEAFYDKSVEVIKASQDLIEFYKGCALPHQSYIIGDALTL